MNAMSQKAEVHFGSNGSKNPKSNGQNSKIPFLNNKQ